MFDEKLFLNVCTKKYHSFDDEFHHLVFFGVPHLAAYIFFLFPLINEMLKPIGHTYLD